MNKKLIAVAIAAAVAAPAAMANDTTLYGKAHVDIRNTDAATDAWGVSSNASRLGVKGSEDLGNGMKAIFGYEMGYNMTDAGTTLGAANTSGTNGTGTGTPITARNAYVGLSGGFGTFLVGRHDTPAKVAFYSVGTDVIGDSVVDLNRIGFTEFRLNNAVAYISPSFSGFTVAAAIVPGETAANNGLADAIDVSVMFAANGLKAAVGYTSADNGMVLGSSGTGGTTTIGANDHEMLQAGVSYTFGDFMVGANWENDDQFAGRAADKEVWALTGKATFGNNYVMAAYGEQELGAADTETFHIAAGHKMSKRTEVYVAYENQEAGAADTDTFALGMIHSF